MTTAMTVRLTEKNSNFLEIMSTMEGVSKNELLNEAVEHLLTAKLQEDAFREKVEAYLKNFDDLVVKPLTEMGVI